MKSRSTLSNSIRIGAGKWRSRVVRFPDVVGLRPTPDRVRETVFNWLGQSLHGKICLDAFAGSGALGFEAASRGAAQVVMCESNATAVLSLQQNVRLLLASHCVVAAHDVLGWLKENPKLFDIVFCDPPFDAGLLAPFLEAISGHLSADALVYVEMREPLDLVPAISADYRVVKSSKTGAVYFGLLRLNTTG